MAVQSDTSSISYTGNNSTVTTYAVPFYFLENSHLSAIAKVTATGVETAVTLTNHTGAGDANGGTVRTSVAVPATSTLTIFRTVPATQTTTYQEGGDFPAASHERALDKLTFLAQQNERAVERSFRVTEGSGEKNEVVAVPNTLLGLDATNQPKALTLSEVKSYLALTDNTLSVPAGIKTFADAGERALAVPDFTGQLATQRDTGVVYVGTGTSAGDWAVVSISDLSIVNADIASDAAIAGSKLADGAITNAKVDAAAAIAGTKIAPDFGSQNVTTTGTLSAGAGSVISGSDNSNAALRITQTGTGDVLLVEDNTNPDATPLVINSVGQIISGATTAFASSAGLQLTADSDTAPNANIAVQRTADTGACVIELQRSRGSGASKTAVQNGDIVGLLNFAAYDGDEFFSVARIAANVDAVTGDNNIAGRLRFLTSPDGSAEVQERMRITNSGEVYIAGTTDQGAYNLQCNGTGVWGAGAYVNGSDERLKENIATIEDGLEVVNKLRPVSFNYKESYSKDTSKQAGFIAQELLVALEGKDYLEGTVSQGPEFYNVAYQNLIPVMAKAIQELSAKVEALEAQLAQA